ncbi:uncharacterized protein LOC106763602 [Vigna radiata var. radiata]|uniref:Uncharacterized protein LOC106763602 n=1 Tax=Vigna radiata var. radiata TaxID=3916 RepID=A0A1S3UBB4_VIGRR|nr:uncharacterized protein LOC106763602 [Vigna radiata var. radiata]
MAFYSKIDLVKCRAFSLSLKGEALEWYYTLPPNIMDNFLTVMTLFKKHYAANRLEEVTVAELVNLKQDKDEPLRSFMQRYNEAARRVKGVNQEFIISNLPNCLKSGYTEIPTNGNKKETRQVREGDRKPPPRRDLPIPLGPRYDHYAHLNAPLAKVFKEALSAELINIKKRPTPWAADETKICLFHDNRGHATEDCTTLRDELERIIRAGYLQQFVKEEPESRKQSPRKEIVQKSPKRVYDTDVLPRDHSRSRPGERITPEAVRGNA